MEKNTNNEDDQEDQSNHTLIDIYHNGKRFYGEIKDEDGNEILLANAENIPKLLQFLKRHIIAHQNREKTVEMLEKAEDDGVIEYNVGNKKFDCESYDSEADICLMLGTDDPVCFDGESVCEHYAQKKKQNKDEKPKRMLYHD